MSASAQTLLSCALAAAGGFAGGWLFFATLRRTVDLWLRGGSAGTALALHLGRFVVLAALLSAAAMAGVWPLLSATLGLLLARHALLSRARG